MSDIHDRLSSVEHLLRLHVEESRTEREISREKADRTLAVLAEIAAELADLARSDEKQWHAIRDLERRVEALETKPARRRGKK